jgi:hypothetical protein
MQNKRLILVGILVILLIIAFPRCTFNNEEEYFGVTECDTVGITYSDLTYIFTDVCASCHFPDNRYNPSIVMDSYNKVKSSFETDLVLPAIKHTGPVKMPPEGYEISDCDIRKIEAWIRDGMPENSK